MIVDDFEFVRPVFIPCKANTISAIDADAELAAPIAHECFEMIARRIAKIRDVRSAPDNGHLTTSGIVEPGRQKFACGLGIVTIVDILSRRISKTGHAEYNACRYTSSTG